MIAQCLLEMNPSMLARYLEEFTHLAIVTLDESMTITDCNQGFLRLLGLPEKPARANLRDLVEPEGLNGPVPSEGRETTVDLHLNLRGPSGTVNGLTCDLYRTDQGLHPVRRTDDAWRE